MSLKTETPSRKSWRDVLKVHEAAELFPRMTPDELQALGEDIIKNNTLTSPIVLWRADPKSPAQLLDGRNRLDAIEMVTGKPVEVGAPSIMAGDFLATDKVTELDGRKVDPWVYAVSANIHRRHLNAEQRRNLIAELIKAQPEKPDLQIAKTVKVSPTTVGTVRREMEAKGDVSKLETRTDTQGRQQPTRKAKTIKEAVEPAKQPPVPTADVQAVRDACAKRIRALRGQPEPPAREDVGATSTGEIARKDTVIEEFRAEKRRLEIRIAGLEGEIADLKVENAALRAQLEATQKTPAVP
jgi:hypothetical protein